MVRRVFYYAALAYFLYRMAVPFAPSLFLAAFAVEALGCLIQSGWKGWREFSAVRLFRHDPSRESDVFFWVFFNSVVPVAIVSFPGMPVADWANAHALFDWSEVPWLAAPVSFAIFSFADFFLHWLCHRVPFLWELHKIHHSATEMTVLTSFRDHLLLNCLKNLVFPLALGLAGFPAGAIGLAVIARQFAIWLQHSNWRSGWGWLGAIVISPRAHRLHHSADARSYNKNFGFDVTLWDRLFGTFQAKPFEGQSEALGLADPSFERRDFVSSQVVALAASVSALVLRRSGLKRSKRPDSNAA